MIPEHIKIADDTFFRVLSETEFLFFNPINYNLAKKKFFSDKINPLLEYPDYSNLFLKNRQLLSKLSFGKRPLDVLFEKKRDDLIYRCNLYMNLGKDKFTFFSKKRWGTPSKKMVDKAYEIVSVKDETDYKKISSKQSVMLLKNELKRYGLEKKWKIEKSDSVSLAAVRYHDFVLSIKKKERFSRKYIERFMIHEVGTHILRYENSLFQPLKVFRFGLANYLGTEEGIAAYNENINGLLTQAVLRQYAGRVIAVDISLKSSFLDVFLEMKRFFKKDESAFKLALRVKRGISNTELPGGCTKDYLYLKGYFDVCNYIDNGGVYEDLYIGKIGVDDVETVKKIPEIRPPRFLPRNIKQESIHSF